jgi:uncharacterized protein (DUF433 family)
MREQTTAAVQMLSFINACGTLDIRMTPGERAVSEKKIQSRAAENLSVPPFMADGQRRRLLKRITVDPRVCHGEPCIRGMRIMVSVIVNSLKAGTSYDDLLLRYPDLTRDDIDAARAYANED